MAGYSSPEWYGFYQIKTFLKETHIKEGKEEREKRGKGSKGKKGKREMGSTYTNNVLLYWGNLRCKQAHTVPGHLTKPMRTPGRGGGVRKTLKKQKKCSTLN